MGTVYRATDTRLQRTVALKFCQSEFTHRFEREARAIAALNQPNICQIYDVGPSYIVIEWVDGAPLLSSGRMTLADALCGTTEIASAMAAAHAKGIIHRDLKPANILLTSDGTVKLVDFGTARQVQHNGGTGLATMTVGRVLIGTPAYMSPEQAECERVDERSDMFSFGVVFYEMLSGRRAFPGNSTASILGAILHRDPDPLNAPPSLSAIVSRCLARAPIERYQSAQELLQALQQAETTVVRARQEGLFKQRFRLALSCRSLLQRGCCCGPTRHTTASPSRCFPSTSRARIRMTRISLTVSPRASTTG